MTKVEEYKAKLLATKKKLTEKKGKKLPSWSEVKEDIQKNRNHSWIREVIRDNDLADKVFESLESGISFEEFAILYPELDKIKVFEYLVDNEYSKARFLYESFILARGLRQEGIGFGDEIVACIDRTPEYLYLVGAASILGAKINLISEKFKHDFIVEKIMKCKNWHSKLTSSQLEEAYRRGIYEPVGEEYEAYIRELGLEIEKQPKRIFFCQDVKVGRMKDVIESCEDIKTIFVPFKRSAKKLSYYQMLTRNYYDEDELKGVNFSELTSYDDFIENGRNYTDRVENHVDLDDDFTISYSSGTTGDPKGIVHSHRFYNTMARYHDPEVSGIPDMTGMRTYSNIPSYSNSYISSVVSDCLMENGVILLDPVDKLEYFPVGLRINGGHMNIGSSSCWELLALQYFNNPEAFKVYRLPNALLNFAVGEELLPGQEKLCNSFLRKVKAGTDLPFKGGIKTPLPIGMMCTAGGSCETGSMFIRLFRSLSSKSPSRLDKKEPIGMSFYDFIEVRILREDGTYALPYEYGRLVVNSDCVMKRYNNNPKATEDMYVTDAYGKKWFNFGVIAYLDENNNVTIKDRYVEKEDIYEYQIADAIARDTKNISSVRVVEVSKGEFVAHVVFQPKLRLSKNRILLSAKERVIRECGNISIAFTEKDLNNYYPLTKSLKKDDKAMIAEGYDKVINLDEPEEVKTLKK